MLVKSTVLGGKHFEIDNRKVFRHIVSHLLETPAYPHIRAYEASQDGRKAWKALRLIYEGQHFKILCCMDLMDYQMEF